MANLIRILSGLLMIAIGNIFEVFPLLVFGSLLFFNGLFYKKKDDGKKFVPHREELPMDEAIVAEMKRDMGDDFVPPKPKEEEKKPEDKKEDESEKTPEKQEDGEQKNEEKDKLA
ncbi:MAG: hypothetical protein GOU98_01290 [Candidatus Altiarchaeota archaeon]|nr:hypothetical protein [Candidatus Altiarchaeota archaeon]